jgi:DNA-binding transcriptional regulator YiaG
MGKRIDRVERSANVKYRGRIVRFLEPCLVCADCRHEFSDSTTYALASNRLREAAGVSGEFDPDCLIRLREQLGISRKMLEVALSSSEKLTIAWEKKRKKPSQLARNIMLMMVGDPTVPARLLLLRQDVWSEFVNRLFAAEGGPRDPVSRNAWLCRRISYVAARPPVHEKAISRLRRGLDVPASRRAMGAGRNGAAVAESLRRAWSDLAHHPTEHSQAVTMITSALDPAGLIDAYRAASGTRRPEIRFAQLVAEKLEERIETNPSR